MMKAVIFDLDGTLTETNVVDNECFFAAATEVLQLESFDTDWESYSHVTDQGVVEEVVMRARGEAVSAEEVAALEGRFIELMEAQPDAKFGALPGASDFLQRLQDDGVPLGLATGCWRSSALLKLRRAGIEIGDLPLSTSSEERSREGIMRTAEQALLERTGAERFEGVVYFGDGQWDVRACKNMNWELIGIGRQIDQLREAGVVKTFGDYRDPEAVLAALELG